MTLQLHTKVEKISKSNSIEKLWTNRQTDKQMEGISQGPSLCGSKN